MKKLFLIMTILAILAMASTNLWAAAGVRIDISTASMTSRPILGAAGCLGADNPHACCSDVGAGTCTALEDDDVNLIGGSTQGFLVYIYDIAGTDATDGIIGIRPDDYVTSGVNAGYWDLVTASVINGEMSVGSGGNPADVGALRLVNNVGICWEADAAGTDICMKVDAAELIQIGYNAGASGVVITPPTTLTDDLTINGNDIIFGNAETISNTTDGDLDYMATNHDLESPDGTDYLRIATANDGTSTISAVSGGTNIITIGASDDLVYFADGDIKVAVDGSIDFLTAAAATTTTTAGGFTFAADDPAAGSGQDYFTISGTLPIANNSDVYRGLYVNLTTTANHTGAANETVAIDIAATDGDAEMDTYGIRIGNMANQAAIEQAIEIGTGWDAGIDLVDDTANILHSGATSLTVASTSGTVIVEGVTFTGPAMSGVSSLGASGLTTFTNATEASAANTAAVVLTGGLGIAKNIWSAGDIKLDSDSSVITFGDGQDVTLTHTNDVGLAVNLNLYAATYGSDGSITDAELKTLDDGLVTEILVGGGAGSAPSWTTVTGTGAPMRGTSPALTTSVTTTSTSFTALAGATTLLTIGGTGASASMFAPSTLDTTSAVTGAIRTSGGISAAKDVWVGDDLIIAGLDIMAADGTDEVISLVDVASAVNELSVSNSATGTGADNQISLIPTGDNGVIGMLLDTKAGGTLTLGTADSLLAVASTTVNIAAGAVSGVTTLGMGGALSGVTTLGASGLTTFTDATEATGAAIAAVELTGGLGIAKNIWSAGNIVMDSDSSVITFGDGQDITVTHVNDAGLLLKQVTDADGNPFNLTLQTGETDIAVDNVLGGVYFQAPDEGAGTDAILVAAGVEAVSEGDFSSSNNATKLSFLTAATDTAAETMSLSSVGLLTVNGGIASQTPQITTPSSFTMSGAGLYGGTYIGTGATTVALPAIGAGMNFTIQARGAFAVTIDPDGTEKIWLNGVDCTAGFTLVGGGTAGDIVVLQYSAAGEWDAVGNGFTCGA